MTRFCYCIELKLLERLTTFRETNIWFVMLVKIVDLVNLNKYDMVDCGICTLIVVFIP
jgi:hypothetical protein